KRASAYRRALRRQSGIFAEPHAGIIPLKRRSASCWKACVARTVLLSCAARKGSIRTCTTVGRRSSWRRARNGSPATPRVRRPRTGSKGPRVRRDSARKPRLGARPKTGAPEKAFSGMERTLHEVFRIREVRDHRTGGTVVALNPPDTGSNRDPEIDVLRLVQPIPGGRDRKFPARASRLSRVRSFGYRLGIAL